MTHRTRTVQVRSTSGTYTLARFFRVSQQLTAISPVGGARA